MENKGSVQGRKRGPNFDSLEQDGDWYIKPNEFEGGLLYLHCQLPGANFCAIPIQRGPHSSPEPWGWDGNEDAPTITPSINLVGYWHGFFEKGYFRSC
jgi:hypothetical protein